jgi:carbamoyltransferase
MYLGIVPSHDGLHHDPSACIIGGGEIIAFIEEERISRNKHAEGEFPINAIKECLRIASVELGDIDEIGLSRNYNNRRKGLGRLARRSLRSDSIGLGEKLWDTLVLPIRQTATMTNESLRSLVVTNLSSHFSVDGDEIPPISFVNHQLTHATSAFYPSGFDDALVVSLDNYGGHLSGAVYLGDGTGLREIKPFLRFNSLGRFYADITEFLGFQRSNGEGKVMGLAPYGKQNDRVQKVLESYISFENGSFDTEPLTFRKPGDALNKLERDLGVEPRYWKDEITQYHKDIAFHAQRLLEEVVTDLISHYIRKFATRNVCLGGGVALNCKMNKKIRELPGVDDVFVQPAANDASGSLGAAIELNRKAGNDLGEQTHMYLGTDYTNEEIIEIVEIIKVPYERVDTVPETVAELLSEDAIVGWYQGRMEGGPRALGNRSILADPRTIESRDNVNKHVKHREEWRPFAPSMLPEDAERFLEGNISKASYFMIDTYETTPEGEDTIPAVLHPSDTTTRPQIVTEDRNKRYYELLQEFKSKTGVGAVLNTSFNDSGEPIVRTPHEAVRDFYSMGLDALVMNDILLQK